MWSRPETALGGTCRGDVDSHTASAGWLVQPEIAASLWGLGRQGDQGKVKVHGCGGVGCLHTDTAVMCADCHELRHARQDQTSGHPHGRSHNSSLLKCRCAHIGICDPDCCALRCRQAARALVLITLQA